MSQETDLRMGFLELLHDASLPACLSTGAFDHHLFHLLTHGIL